MLHAIEVSPAQRRQKVAVNMMGTAAKWAQNHGAKRFSLVTTLQNAGSNALYTSLGMQTVGHYHSRIK
jgi:ribosomal protein S18 acetylase RimI-like enzyme